MGFTVYYRSSTPVDPARAGAIRRAADAANAGRTWLHCEPVCFFEGGDDGHLEGGSKPNFIPDPADAASAAREGLPDGTTNDLLDILCRLSRDHGVDWEMSDDEDPAIGAIRAGECDEELRDQMDALAELYETLGELGPDD